MERSSRQYLVLGDPSLFEVYQKFHEGFQDTAGELSGLPLDDAQRSLLKELLEKEQSLYDTLSEFPYDSEKSRLALSEFSSLGDLVSPVLSESTRLIDREINSIQKMAEEAERVLFWQLVAVAPVVFGLVVVFTALIARPIRKIDQSIHRLGDGAFSSEIVITGPQDLEYLGKRLDWLRLRLIDLEEQKNKFLSHISHELKTPLTAIREGAELLVDQVGGRLTDEQRKVASILRENSVQLQKMIENLVNFRAVSLRHSALYMSPLKLKALIEKVAADQELAIMAKSIRLELNLGEVCISGDEEKLTTILDNLLSNAIKFSSYGGQIRIRLKREGPNAVLDIQDSGPGIHPDDRDRVFDAFYQGGVLPEGYMKGTGIGLSVVAEYVRLHHGSIEIMDGETQGAHFRVILPVGGDGDMA